MTHTSPFKDFNWGLNDKSNEKAFANLSLDEKKYYVEKWAYYQLVTDNEITPFKSRTGNTVLETEFNFYVEEIREKVRADQQGFIDKFSEVIVVEGRIGSERSPITGADPINLFNGNFTYSNIDFSIVGSSMDFVFTRTYSNQVFYRGPLGEKWDHSYNLRLMVDADFNIIYRSTGRISESIYRRHNIHGYWLAEGGEDGVITQTSEGFVWRSSNGVEFHYLLQLNTRSDVWLISKIKDRFGNYLQFDYNDGLLSRILVNHPERKVNFRYDNENRIVEISDFSNRHWSYTYDEFDDLITVTTPATEQFRQGLTTRYEYTTATLSDSTLQHNLIAIIDANGQIYLENEYGSNPGMVSYNRVVRQRQGSGETIFDYEDVVEDSDYSYEIYQQPAHQTIVTERNGHLVRYLFNSFGNMVFEEKYVRINGLPKLISTHYRYNNDGNLIGTISPEGVITQFLYGREYFERKWVTGQDYRDTDDEHLDSKARQGFNKLLATVKRGRHYSIVSLNLTGGIWADIFPDIYDTSNDDIIQKFTYEMDYGQPLTISDPRHTYSANPDFFEPADYTHHLTRYTYTSNATSQFHLLDRIEAPLITYPDGTGSEPAILKISLYDEHGHILENIGPGGLVTQFSYYDSNSGPLDGFLKGIHFDPAHLSIKTEFDRDHLGRTVRTYLPEYFDVVDGRFVTETDYNALDQILSVTSTLPFKFRLQRRYSRVGNITKESFERKRADGTFYDEPVLVKTFDYDEEFHFKKITVGGSEYVNHKKSHNIYDGDSRLLIAISPSGRKSKFYYNESSLVAKEVSDHGGIAATIKRYYDGDGRLIRITDASGAQTNFVYDPLGRLIESEDALGNKKLLTYDKLGNVLVERFFEKHADGFRLLYRFEQSYDERGRRIKTGVNKFDKPTEVVGNLQNAFVQQGPGELLTTLYFYDKDGHVIKISDPSGREFKAEYDKFGRLTKRTDPYGNETSNCYDKHGNLIRSDIMDVIRDGTSNGIIGHRYFATVFIHDELNRLVRGIDSLGNQTHYEYDSLNQMTSVIDALSNSIETDYDIFGRIIQINRFLEDELDTNSPVNVGDQYVYDRDDFLIKKTDALGRITEFGYDSMGRLISSILPDGSRDGSVYDRSSRIITHKDCNGLVRKYQRDLLGRLLTLQIDDTELLPGLGFEGSRFASYEYDGLGRTIYCENEFCKYSLSYNSLGWLVEENNIFIQPENPATERQFLIRRSYNINGALSDLLYPSGRRIHYNRDILDRIISIEQKAKGLDYPGDDNHPEDFVIMNVEYEGLQRSEIIRHNQTSTKFSYDRGGRMIEIKHIYKDGLLLQLQYLYDALNNIRQKIEHSSELSRARVFHYDSLYRIRDISKIESSTVNNLESLFPATAPVADIIPDTQSEMNDLIDENIPINRRYTYDAVGNRLTKKENVLIEQYVANDLDQYSSIDNKMMKYDKVGNLIEDEKWVYEYNFNNQLSSITRKDNNKKTKFYYDPLGRKILEMRDHKFTSILYDTWNVIEEYDSNGIISSTVSDEGMDNVLQISTNNTNFWSYSDILKSVIHLMKGEEKDQYYGYDEFGKIITPVQSGITANRFTGKRLIPELEKYDFIFRTYDPKMGRFLQRDPNGYVDGSNLYSYASNNPLSSTDPFGTERHDRGETSARVEIPPELESWRRRELLTFDTREKHERELADAYYESNDPSKIIKNEDLARYWEDLGEFLRPEWDEHVNKSYGRYLQGEDQKLKKAIRRMDTAANIGNLIGGITMGVAFSFLAPTAAAVVGAYDAGVTIPELATGKSSGVHTVNLLTGNIDTGRNLSTGEKVLGGVGVGLFMFGTAMGIRANGAQGNPIGSLKPEGKGGPLIVMRHELDAIDNFQELTATHEYMAGFRISGNKGLVGDTFTRNIYYIEAVDKGKNSIGGLVRAIEQEAVAAGATRLSISGHVIIENRFLNSRIASFFGFSHEIQAGEEPFTIFLSKVLTLLP